MASKSITGPQKKALQQRLKATLKDNPYEGNQTKLAAAIGIRQPTLSDFLNHGSKAGIGFLRAVAAFYGCSTEDLLEPTVVSDDMFPLRAEAIAAVGRRFSREAVDLVQRMEFAEAGTFSLGDWVKKLENAELQLRGKRAKHGWEEPF